MPPHEKVYYARRSTPEIVARGKPGHPKPGYGPETSRQPATEAEERTIAQGRWVRTREDGRRPNAAGAKQSRYRPKLAAKHRMAQAARRERDT